MNFGRDENEAFELQSHMYRLLDNETLMNGAARKRPFGRPRNKDLEMQCRVLFKSGDG